MTTRTRKANAGKYAAQMRMVQRRIGETADEFNAEQEEVMIIRRELIRRAMAHLLMVFLYRLVWAANIFGTAFVVTLVGLRASAKYDWSLTAIDYAWIAVLFQLAITLLEQHLWKTGKDYQGTWREQRDQFWHDLDKSTLVFIVCIGALDALSTAWLILMFLQSLNLPVAIPYLFATIIAVTMAMLVEPAMKKHRIKAKELMIEAGYKRKTVRILWAL